MFVTTYCYGLEEVDENSEISSIKIWYNDTITAAKRFPNSFWIEFSMIKIGKNYKFEFDLIDNPSSNVPINVWKANSQENTFALHSSESHQVNI